MNDKQKSIFEDGQILLFDKPVYWTSFDLINKVRIIIRSTFGIKKIKVGHAGTLDLDKEYIATIHLGETTPSFDLETETDNSYPTDHITEEMVKDVLAGFLGEQNQLPPMYSAKLISGKRAYEFARKGIEIKLDPVTVFFREIELLSFEIPEIKIRLLCSKGTYVRSFARDFGTALKSGGYLSSLERTAIGAYHVQNAYSLDKFKEYIEQMNSPCCSETISNV
jgi:tRNA pseudouridine55 synthase